MKTEKYVSCDCKEGYCEFAEVGNITRKENDVIVMCEKSITA